MLQYIQYILFDIKNSLFFRIIYLIEKIGKFSVFFLSRKLNRTIPFFYFFRKDYILKNSDGNWKIKNGTDYDTLISPLFEPELRAYFSLPDGGTFIDIGAHIGKWSVYVARQNPNNKVYAIDANKYTFEYLEENINLNKLTDQITPVNIGISSESGVGILDYDHVNTGGSGIGTGKVGESIEKLEVPIIPFSEFLEKYQLHSESIRLVKIDVEGHEYSVLQGMREFLTNQKSPLRIICEIHPTSPHKNEVLDMMKDLGFGCQFAPGNSVDHIFSK